MSRTAAAKATEAAETLLAWLRDQPPPVFPPPPGAVPAAPSPGAAEMPSGIAAAGPAGDPPAPVPVARAATASLPPPGPAAAAVAARATPADAAGGAPLSLPHTDWLYHRLAFRAAAAGAGVIPWQLEHTRIAEDFFHLLAAPQQRSLSLPGARILAGQLGDAVARRHELALARVGHSQACPFDLQALVPVPREILRRGPDDAISRAWLWAHWGTTQELRHVTVDPAAGPDRGHQPGGESGLRISFWSADWSRWRGSPPTSRPCASRSVPSTIRHDRRCAQCERDTTRNAGPVRLGGQGADRPARHGTRAVGRRRGRKVRSTGCWRWPGPRKSTWQDCQSPR